MPGNHLACAILSPSGNDDLHHTRRLSTEPTDRPPTNLSRDTRLHKLILHNRRLELGGILRYHHRLAVLLLIVLGHPKR